MAMGCSAEANNLVLFIGESIVVGDLLHYVDVPLRVDDNLLAALNCDNLGVAIRLQNNNKSKE